MTCEHCNKEREIFDGGLCFDCWRCPECKSSFCSDCASDPHAEGCTYKLEV